MFRITTFRDYREYSPAARGRVLARIRDASFHAVRFRLDRAVTESAFHRYDDSFADSFFEDIAAAGLKAVPVLSFHTPPWARDSEPSFNDPGTWRNVRLFLEHVVTRYRNRPELAFFQVIFKPSAIPDSDPAFREYLMRRYPSLKELNRSLNTCYSALEDISLKDCAVFGIRMAMERRLFRRRAYERKLADLKETIRAVSPHTLSGTVFLSRRVACSDCLSALAQFQETADRCAGPYLIHWNPSPGTPVQEVELCACASGACGMVFPDVCGTSVPFSETAHAHPDPDAVRRLPSVFLEKCRRLCTGFSNPAEVGLLHSRRTGRLSEVRKQNENIHKRSLRAWCRALTAASLPFHIVEEDAELPQNLKLMILPAVAALDDADAERLLSFAWEGGTLFCEGGCGHYNGLGACLDPEHRFLAEATGVMECPECVTPGNFRIKYGFGAGTFLLSAGEVFTPWLPVPKFSETLVPLDGKRDLLCRVPYGKGKIILCAPSFGAYCREKRNTGFEGFVRNVCSSAGVHPPVRILKPAGSAAPLLKVLENAERRMVFVFFSSAASGCELEFPAGFWKKQLVGDMLRGGTVRVVRRDRVQRMKLKASPGKAAVLYE